jgi:hypothetical protein
MEFSKEELAVIHQALFVARLYYLDLSSQVNGMVKANESTRQSRLTKIEPVMDKIEAYAQSLS